MAIRHQIDIYCCGCETCRSAIQKVVERMDTGRDELRVFAYEEDRDALIRMQDYFHVQEGPLIVIDPEKKRPVTIHSRDMEVLARSLDKAGICRRTGEPARVAGAA